MQEVASISLIILPNGEPGVKFNGSEAFGCQIPTITRVALLIAAIQLCGAAINSICEENPDDSPDIDALMNAISISPSALTVN